MGTDADKYGRANHVYVAGPMRGLPEFNFPAFDECRDYLNSLGGFIVFSPADRDRGKGFDPSGMIGSDEELTQVGFSVHEAMRADLDWITSHADTIVLLPGWSRSTGAQLEKRVGESIGCAIRYYWPDAPAGYRLSEWPTPTDEPTPADNDFETYDPETGIHTLTDPTEVELLRIDHEDGSPILTMCAEGGVEAGYAHCRYCPLDNDGSSCFLNCDTQAAEYIAKFDSQGNLLPDGEVRVTNPTTGGAKGSKPERYDLIPTHPLAELARVYGYGATKYADRNWERGYDWSLSYAALQRHVNAYWSGETYDPETGLHHLAHAMFHCMAPIEWERTHPELDDRPSTSRLRDVNRPSAKAIKEAEVEECLRREVQEAEEDRVVTAWQSGAKGIHLDVPIYVDPLCPPGKGFLMNPEYIEAPEWRSRLVPLAEWFRTEL